MSSPLVRLQEISEELIGLYGELSEVEKAKKQAYDDGYWGCGEASHNARYSAAQHAGLDYTKDEIDLLGSIKILQEEQATIRFALNHTGESR